MKRISIISFFVIILMTATSIAYSSTFTMNSTSSAESSNEEASAEGMLPLIHNPISGKDYACSLSIHESKGAEAVFRYTYNKDEFPCVKGWTYIKHYSIQEIKKVLREIISYKPTGFRFIDEEYKQSYRMFMEELKTNDKCIIEFKTDFVKFNSTVKVCNPKGYLDYFVTGDYHRHTNCFYVKKPMSHLKYPVYILDFNGIIFLSDGYCPIGTTFDKERCIYRVPLPE